MSYGGRKLRIELYMEAALLERQQLLMNNRGSSKPANQETCTCTGYYYTTEILLGYYWDAIGILLGYYM